MLQPESSNEIMSSGLSPTCRPKSASFSTACCKRTASVFAKFGSFFVSDCVGNFDEAILYPQFINTISGWVQSRSDRRHISCSVMYRTKGRVLDFCYETRTGLDFGVACHPDVGLQTENGIVVLRANI